MVSKACKWHPEQTSRRGVSIGWRHAVQGLQMAPRTDVPSGRLYWMAARCPRLANGTRTDVPSGRLYWMASRCPRLANGTPNRRPVGTSILLDGGTLSKACKWHPEQTSRRDVSIGWRHAVQGLQMAPRTDVPSGRLYWMAAR